MRDNKLSEMVYVLDKLKRLDKKKAKVIELVTNRNKKIYMITSPATKQNIVFDERWDFNGDFENPTFRPSMLIEYPVENAETGHVREHFFVINGVIQYLPDCHHAMAGKSVGMIDCEW